MPSKRLQHSRQYDIVLFGATGYTGQYTAEYMAGAMPTDLRWAIAGRSQEKLDKVAADIKAQNPDRSQPAVEICSLDEESLAGLAKKTAILMTTVGPYSAYGSHAFKACAENGTHYFDVTGELPWVLKMIEKYEGAAKASGALLFPQIGLESAPSDLMAWSLASAIREELGAQTRGVTMSIEMIDCSPSGGTIDSLFNLLDRFSLKDLSRSFTPYALSPVPNPNRPRGPKQSIAQRLTGLVTVPGLGLLTTSITGRVNVGMVERSWGLLASTPSRQQQAYGPNFSFREYMRAHTRLQGVLMHLAITVGAAILFMLPRPARRLVQGYLPQPGQGKTREEGAREIIRLRAIADADVEPPKQAICSAEFRGSMYHVTAIIMAQAALSVLEDYDDLQLGGGIYTGACLGQPFIDRLGGAGFKIESKVLKS